MAAQTTLLPSRVLVNRFFRSALFPLVVIVLLVYLASQTLIPKRDNEAKLTYSELITQAKQGNVSEVKFNPNRQSISADARLGAEGEGQLPDAAVADPVPERPHGEQRQVRLQGHRHLDVGRAPHRAAPDPAPRRLLDLPHEPDAGRRLEGDELRQEPREADVARLAEGHLQGRRRRGRGGRGAARDQGVPREPEEVPGARRADPEGRAPLRASRHRQDAARARDGRRGRRAVLLDLGLRLRRDVRRRRRLARARPVRAGEAGEPLHHLHRRDRRRRPPPWRRHGRRPRRARADAQPAPRRDGRLRAEGQRDPDRRHEPPRHPRSRAAAARAASTARSSSTAPTARAAATSSRCTRRASRSARSSTSTSSPRRRRASPAPISRT